MRNIHHKLAPVARIFLTTRDGHPAFQSAIEQLKRSGQLGQKCRCRRAPYLNNIVEQDRRLIKKRIMASQWFRSVNGALNTIAGYKAKNIIREGSGSQE